MFLRFPCYRDYNIKERSFLEPCDMSIGEKFFPQRLIIFFFPIIFICSILQLFHVYEKCEFISLQFASEQRRNGRAKNAGDRSIFSTRRRRGMRGRKGSRSCRRIDGRNCRVACNSARRRLLCGLKSHSREVTRFFLSPRSRRHAHDIFSLSGDPREAGERSIPRI